MKLIASDYVNLQVCAAYEISGHISEDSKVEIESFIVFRILRGRCMYDYFLLMRHEEKI